MTTKRGSAAAQDIFGKWWGSLTQDQRTLFWGNLTAVTTAFYAGLNATAQPRWIATFEPTGTTPTKICESAKRTAEIIFEEMEERLKEAGVTRKTDKTLSAIPAILERLVQYTINEAVHDAADAPEGDQS